MIKELTRYQTSDGETFDDLEDARRHELASNICEVLLSTFGQQGARLPPQDLADLLANRLYVDGDGRVAVHVSLSRT